MPTSKPGQAKITFGLIIQDWVERHRVLSQHFRVIKSSVLGGPDSFDILYKCPALRGLFDSSAEIVDDVVDIIGEKISAAQPDCFKQLESKLYIIHDRSSEYNVVAWREACLKLHPCTKNKAFCGC